MLIIIPIFIRSISLNLVSNKLNLNIPEFIKYIAITISVLTISFGKKEKTTGNKKMWMIDLSIRFIPSFLADLFIQLLYEFISRLISMTSNRYSGNLSIPKKPAFSNILTIITIVK